MKFANVAIAVAAVAMIAADEPKKDELQALKGNWTAVSMKAGGQELPADEVKKIKVNFADKTYTNTVDDQVIEEGGFTFDASKTPKTIDFDIKKGPDEGKKQLGLYKIEGDKLTIVVTPAGTADRPKSLKPEESESAIEIVLERAKS